MSWKSTTSWSKPSFSFFAPSCDWLPWMQNQKMNKWRRAFWSFSFFWSFSAFSACIITSWFWTRGRKNSQHMFFSMQCVPCQQPLVPLVGFFSSNPSEQAIHPNRSLNITESFDHDDGDDNDDGDGDDDGDDDDDDDDNLMMMMNLNKNAQIILWHSWQRPWLVLQSFCLSSWSSGAAPEFGLSKKRCFPRCSCRVSSESWSCLFSSCHHTWRGTPKSNTGRKQTVLDVLLKGCCPSTWKSHTHTTHTDKKTRSKYYFK